MTPVFSIFLRIVCYALVAATAWETGRGWLRYRDRYRADILWVVGLLVLILLAGDWALDVGVRHSPVGFLFSLLFLLQPYFLLRLVRRFRAVPAALPWLTAAVAIAGATVWSISSGAPRAGWSTLVSAYFIAQLGYAAWAFASESGQTGGVTGTRLWLAAFGTWLHVVIAGVIAVETSLPALADGAGPQVRQLLGVGVFACYYAGLVAPRRLRMLWAERLIYQHIQYTASRQPDERAREAAADLSRAIARGVASAGRVVLLFDDEDPTLLTARAASVSSWRTLRVRPEHGLLGRALARGTPVVGAAKDFEPELAQSASELGLSAWAVPIVGAGHRWGAVVVVQQIGSLFPDDDLDLISVLSAHTAASLEHARLVSVEREHRTRLAESRLRDSEARFSQILQSILDYAVLLVDDAGRVVEWKAGAEAIFGYAFEEMRGQPAAPLFDRTSSDFETLLGDARTAGVVHEDSKCRRRDGSIFTASMTVRPTSADAANLSGFVIVTRDETERRELGERLQQAQKMEAVGQLAGGVAHDFNNLLTAVLGYASMIESHPDYNQTLNDHVTEIRRTAERATALTRRLLAFSRRQVVEPRRVNLRDVVSELVPMLDRVLEDRVIENRVTLEFVADAPAGWILADPVQIEQVVLNLAINARDAMPKGGHIEIRTGVTVLAADTRVGDAVFDRGPYATLKVTDTGVGIDADTRARIFEPFFTTKEIGYGTGLGLSTVYGIVKQIGGGIRVESERGKGAAFQIVIPSVTAPSPVARAINGTRSETILVVDDDNAIRRLVAAWLKASGYSVVTAEDASSAISAASDRPDVALVVTDVMMPGGSGPALVETLRQTAPDLRALYISGYAHTTLTTEGHLPPGTHFLAKPFSRDLLVGRVRQILERVTEAEAPPL